jgi:hypothetical protein
MTDVLKEVKGLRTSATSLRDAAVLDGNALALEDARAELEKAVALLRPLVPVRGSQWSDADKEYGLKLYQCLGSLGGTWRDLAELAVEDVAKNDCWDQSMKYYDEGHAIESGTHDRYANFGFVDSYNLLQRLVVRVLRAPRCLESQSTELGHGLNVPQELAAAERIVNEQLAEPDGARKNDAWAMADLALLLILRGHTREEAWRKFAESNRSSQAYESNHRAFAALVKSGEKHEDSPRWLTAARETVAWLAERLKTLYGIEV